MLESSSLAPVLGRTLGYSFRDPSLLQAALIHTSYVNERPGRGLESNERLEFLGDAVLGVVVAHRLYELRPESSEGELTVLRAWLVRQSTLARWARQASLGPHDALGDRGLRDEKRPCDLVGGQAAEQAQSERHARFSGEHRMAGREDEP